MNKVERYTIEDFPYGALVGRTQKAKQGHRKKDNTYVDVIATFDHEVTTFNHEYEDGKCKRADASSYEWGFDCYYDGVHHVIIGRELSEFATFCYELNQILSDTLIIWIHNLAYEFAFLKSYFTWHRDTEGEAVFCLDNRKPAYAWFGNIKFACSLILTNTNLAELTKGMDYEKLGDYDYNLRRHSTTVLTDNEVQYQINDVTGLAEAIEKRLELYNDDFYSIPMTSTGYVRREAKKVFYPYTKAKTFEKDDYHVYKLLREAYRGGNTHANRFYSGKILKNVRSYDRSSSYPDVIIHRKYPITKYELTELSVEDAIKAGFAVLTKVKFTNLRLKDKFEPLPYMSESKCYPLINAIIDNGRLLSAEIAVTAFTDIDYKIIKDQYTWDSMEEREVYISIYDYLPIEFREMVIKYYNGKTALKKVDDDAYSRYKELINALYGMMCEAIKPGFIYDGEFKEEELTDEEMEQKYNETNKFLMYRWGCVVCAWARYELQRAIDVVGYDFVYADTDSVKFLNNHDEDFAKLNKEFIRRAKKSGAYASDRFGEVHYCGSYEDEGMYERFRTWGAKKYAYEQEGKLHLTVSGVPKKEGAKELGCLENFKPGFIFNAGKVRPIYNDDTEIRKVWMCDHNNFIYEATVASGIALVDVEYKLGITDEYEDIIKDCEINMYKYIDKVHSDNVK